jgi:hypothetical protein
MTTTNAIGFFLLGTAMIFVPALAPGFFAVTNIYGYNTSALWLEVMGSFNSFLGLVVLVLRLPEFTVRLMAWRLRTVERIAPAVLLRPAMRNSLRQSFQQKAERQIAA